MFNKSFANMKRDYANGNGLLTSIFSGENITSKDISAIQAMNESMKNGSTVAQAWTDNMKGCTVAAKEQVKQCLINKGSLSDLSSSMEEMTLSAKAGQVALKGLAIAGNMIAMWAISKVLQVATEKITELANASEIAEEKATNFANSVNNATKDMSSNFSTLSSLNGEYQKLSEGVNALGENVSLSTDEYGRYKEVVQQISDIMPNMTTYFNAQGEKIAFAKGELSDLNAEYEEYIQKQAKEFLVNGDEDGNKLQDALDNFANNSQMDFWEELKNTIKNSFGSYDMSDVPIDTMISTLEALQDKSREEMISYLNDIDLDGNGQYLQTESNRAKAIAQDMISDTFGDINKLTDEEFNTLQETIANNIESLQNSNDVDMSAITSGLLQTAYSKDDFWAVGEDIRNDITTMLSSIDADTWKSLGITEQSDVENFVGQLITAISSNEDGIADAWNGLFSPDLETLPVNEYIEKINSYMDVIADVLGLDEEGKKNLMISLGFDINTNSAMLNGVKEKLDDVGDSWVDTLNISDLEIVASDEFDQALEKQKSDLNGASLSAEDYAIALQSVKDAQNQTSSEPVIPSYDELSESAKTASDAVDTLRSAVSSVNDAFAEQAENGSISVDTMLSLVDAGYATALQFDEATGACTINKEAMLELVQAKIQNQIADLQTLQTDIATKLKDDGLIASESAKGFIALAESKAAAATAEQLDLVGDYNDAEAKIKALENAMSNIEKIGKGSYSTKKKSKSSSSSSKDAWKEEFQAQYDLLKHNLEMQYITEEQYYSALNALNEKYFANNEKYTDEYRKYQEEIYKGLQKVYKDYIENNMSYLEKALDANKISFGHYSNAVKKMLDDMWQEGKISAEQYWSYTQTMLEKQLDIYDSVISAVTTLLDNEIDKLQDSIDAIEEQNDALEEQQEKMESAINAVVTYYDSLIDKENDSIKALEDKNDSIQSQIDKYDSLISVADRLYEDEQNALKEQQNAIQDSIDAINDENSALDLQYRKEQAIYNLRKAETQRTKKVFNGTEMVYTTDQSAIRDAQNELQDIKTEELVNQLEKEKDALQESIDALQEYRDALNEIGDSYNRVVDERNVAELLGVDYKDKILGVNIDDWEVLKDRYVSANDEMADNTNLIDSLNQKIDLWEKEKSQWSSLTKAIKDETDTQNAIELFGANWERRINEGRFNEYEQFKNNYLSIQSQINDNTQLINSYNEKINYYNGLKEQWSSITNVYNEEQNRLHASQVLGAKWESDVLSGRLETLTNFKNNYVKLQQDIANAAEASAKAVVEANKSAAASATTTPTTTSGSSGGSSGGSGGGGKTTTSTPKPYWTYIKYGSGYSTSSQATSAIGLTSGANGIAQISGKWYVVKFLEGYDNNTEAAKATLKKKESDKKNREKYGYYKRYASGTTNAKKGINLVGEAGTETYIDNDGNVSLVTKPSLIEMEGGETVKNAKETKNLLNPDNLVPIETMELPGINGKILKLSTDEFMNKVASVMPNYSSMIQSAIQMPKYDFTPISRDNSTSVSIGEIHLHEVNDVDSFANAIIRELPSKISQKLGQ